MVWNFEERVFVTESSHQRFGKVTLIALGLLATISLAVSILLFPGVVAPEIIYVEQTSKCGAAVERADSARGAARCADGAVAALLSAAILTLDYIEDDLLNSLMDSVLSAVD